MAAATAPKQATEDTKAPSTEEHSADEATAESVRRFFDASNSSMMGGWT